MHRAAPLQARMAEGEVDLIEKQPKVSVVVPVFNREVFLDRAVGSVAAQTLRDIEILLVDDGSTDASPALCDEWAKKDTRVRVLHTPNRGVAMARNAGIDAAKGAYIAFVDSDDWVLPEMYETMYNCAACAGADLAKCGVLFCEERSYASGEVALLAQEAAENKAVHFPEQTVPGREYLRRLALQRVDGSCCSLLVRAELLRNIRFQDVFVEDGIFNAELAGVVATASLLPQFFYIYMQHNATSRVSRDKTVMDRIEETSYLLKLFALCDAQGLEDAKESLYAKVMKRTRIILAKYAQGIGPMELAKLKEITAFLKENAPAAGAQ